MSLSIVLLSIHLEQKEYEESFFLWRIFIFIIAPDNDRVLGGKAGKIIQNCTNSQVKEEIINYGKNKNWLNDDEIKHIKLKYPSVHS